jgi:preprotein translocase subunit SecE
MNPIKEMPADSESEDTSDRDLDRAAATGATGATESSVPGGSSSVLGLTRWVQYVFVVGAALLLWFLDKVATVVWQNFAEPPAVVITAVSGVISIIAAVVVYRTESAHTLVTQVVAELAKVSWPSRKETYASTIVVIVTSLIAAGIVGGFDFVWSFFTDLLYKHKV